MLLADDHSRFHDREGFWCYEGFIALSRDKAFMIMTRRRAWAGSGAAISVKRAAEWP
jgi:hypothetical protein